MTPPSPRTWHLLFLLSLPLALLALVAPETQVHWYDPAKLGLFDPLEPFNEWEEPIGFGEDVYVERQVAGQVFWPTPFVLVEGVGLPDINDSSTWLKVGALARSATAFYGLELVNDVTKWMEIGGTVTYESTWMQINMARKPKGMPFLGRGDLTAITIRDATGNQVYFDPGSVRVETEGGTKSRWPKGTNILDPTFPVTDDFPVMTEFDVILSSEGYGMALVPRHKFTFPYKAPCIVWYFPSTNTINLPAVESPDPEEPSWP